MDFIVGLSLIARRHDSILVVFDTLTKSAHFMPMHTMYQAPNIARFFISEMASFEFLYGRPCQTPLSWDRLEDSLLVGLETIQEMEEKIKMIIQRIKEVHDH
jgi:hypothetical protein